MKAFYTLLLFCTALLPNTSAAQLARNTKIPDAELSVSARERDNTVGVKAVYYFILECVQGDCTLTTLRFQCEPYDTSNTLSFRPEIWRSSTEDGTLKVTNLGNQLEVAETRDEPPVNSMKGDYLFGFLFDKKLKIADKVTSFSGAWVISVRAMKKVYTTTFVPYIGKDVLVQLDCNTLWLPGVDTSK